MTEDTLFTPLSQTAQADTSSLPADAPAAAPRASTTGATRPARKALLLATVFGLLLWAGYQLYPADRKPPVVPDWVALQEEAGTASQGGGVASVEFTRHEITNQDYLYFVRQQPDFNQDSMLPGMHDGDYLKHWLASDRYPQDAPEQPVTYVSWYAAQAYCQWIGGRLPHLEEWQRATQTMRNNLSPSKAAMFNLCDRRCAVHEDISPNRSPKDISFDDGYSETAPVTAGFPSSDGLTHLYGNVAEWLDETSGEKGNIIGGSFLGTLAEAASPEPVLTPKRLTSRDLGFRCARRIQH